MGSGLHGFRLSREDDVRMKSSDWRDKFIVDVKNKLKAANLEFKQYKQTSSIIYLQQAGGKIFSVVENYLMVKHDYRARSYADLYEKIKSNSHDLLLLKDAFQLHKFFYNGDLQMPVYQAEDEFIRISAILEARIKRLN